MRTTSRFLEARLEGDWPCIRATAELVQLHEGVKAQDATRTGLPARFWVLRVDAGSRAAKSLADTSSE
jgi:hypothetical protein